MASAAYRRSTSDSTVFREKWEQELRLRETRNRLTGPKSIGQQAVYDALQKNVAGVSASKRKKPESAPEDEPDTYALANPLKEKKKKAENGSDDDDDGAGLDALFNSIRAVKNSKPNTKKRLSETDEGDEDGCNSENDDDGAAADSTTATPKKRGRKTESDAASRSKSADTPEKIEKLKQSEARKQASELAKTGDGPNVAWKDRVKHVTAVHTARQVITAVHNVVENLQDPHMFNRVTLKAYKDLHAKVDKALSTETIALYMIAGEDPLCMADADLSSTKGSGMEVSIRKRLVPAGARPYVIFVLLCFARFAFESL